MSLRNTTKNIFNEIKANIESPLVDGLFFGAKNVANLDTVKFCTYVQSKHPSYKFTSIERELRANKARHRHATETKHNGVA
jgi:hypothetical protein